MLKLAVFLAVVCFVACQDSEYELRKSVADILMKDALKKMVGDGETKKVDGENVVEMMDDIINTKDPSSRRSYGDSDNAVEDALRKMMEDDKRRGIWKWIKKAGETVWEVAKNVVATVIGNDVSTSNEKDQKRKSYENHSNTRRHNKGLHPGGL